MTDRDPVQEAVERAYQAWLGAPLAHPAEDLHNYVSNILTAALAPYGGLEAAIKKLEEISQNDSNLKRLIAEYAAEGIGPDGPD